MDDSKELKSRIIQMRQENHIDSPQENNAQPSNESRIKEIDDSANKDSSIESINEVDNQRQNKNDNKNLLKKEEAFKLLANKFNDSVEVILELTKRVEKLETIVRLQSMQAESSRNQTEKYSRKKSHFKFYILFFIIIFSSYVFYYEKIDLSTVKLIFDEFSKIFNKS
tara:strand:- start:24 stop:527 length:504 start_codon:yes stop_codon:yes gene_type:complete